MTTKPEFRLPSRLNRPLLTLAADLNEYGGIMSSRWGTRPKKWKESDEGNVALAWLEDLDNLVEAMTEFAEVEEG